MNDREDELERALRGALAREAEQIEARPGDYQRLQQRLVDEPGGRRGSAWLPWLATAAAVVTIVGLSGAWLTGRPTETANPAATSVAPQPSPSPSVLAEALRQRVAEMRAEQERARQEAEATAGASPASTPSPTPSPTPVGATRALPVYWIGPAPLGRQGLFREFEPTAVVSAQSAVEAMLTTRPIDPDYSSPWQAAEATVTLEQELITVDLGREAFAKRGVGRDTAEMGLQQLVYTVNAGAAVETGKQGYLPVRILVDSVPDVTVWESLSLAEPIARNPDARAPIWITSPTEGATVPAGEVKVGVYGTGYEANALWVVFDANDPDRLVDQGFVMVGSMGTYAEGSFTVALQPGDYRIRVYGPDMSDRESGFPDDPGDDKVIRVR